MKSDRRQIEELRVLIRELKAQISLLINYNEEQIVDVVTNDLLDNGRSHEICRDLRNKKAIRLDNLKEEYRSDF